MMLRLKSGFRFLCYFVIGIALLLLHYFFCSWSLPFVKANSTCAIPEHGIEIFVKSNGIHTDLVLPVHTNYLNWNDVLPCSDFNDVDERYQYIALGWGDKGFYLDTPTWDDLTAGTAFNAAFGRGGTAMHVVYRYRAPHVDERCKKLILSKDQYYCLINEVMRSFQLEKGKPIMIDHDGYSAQDRFFEATGRYTMFNTCNVWTGRVLRASGVKMGIWTPFQGGIIDHLD